MINPIYYKNSYFDGGFYNEIQEPLPSDQPVEPTSNPQPPAPSPGNVIEQIDIGLLDDFLESSAPPAETPVSDKNAAHEWFLAQMYNQAVESAIANGADPRDLPIPMEYRFGLEARMGMAQHEARVDAAFARNDFVSSANSEIRRRVDEANARLRNAADPQERARLYNELKAELERFSSFMQGQVGSGMSFGDAQQQFYRTSPLVTTNATITTNVAQYGKRSNRRDS